MDSSAQVIIIGGGISGMATALAIEDLARQRGEPVPALLVLEADRRPGGKIQTLHEAGFTCEWGVNGFLNKEPKTLELVQRLGLVERLRPASGAYARRYLYTRGKLRQVHMHPLKFACSGLLPLRGLWRLLKEPWIPRRPAEGDESVACFARRRVGPLAFQVLVDAMQTGIYAGDPEQMSVASCFPRVVEVEQQYGSLIRGMIKLSKERRGKGEPLPGAGPAGHLTSFLGGMQTLTDALAEALGDRLRSGMPVRQLRRSAGGYQVAVEGAGQLAAPVVVLACPAHAAAIMTRELDPALAELLAAIPYPPMAVICLGYQRSQVAHRMDGFGYLVPRTAGKRILGALWSSSIFPDDAPEDLALLRVMVGGARDPQIVQLSDEELGALVQEEVTAIQGATGAPLFTRVFRHELAIPQYLLGHQARLEQLEQRLAALPALHLTGNAYRGISVNDCARNAWPVAERVLANIARFPSSPR